MRCSVWKNTAVYGWKLVLGISLVVTSASASARPFQSKIPIVDSVSQGYRELYLYGNKPTQTERQSFRLFETRSMSLDQSVRRFISERMLNPGIVLRNSVGLGLVGEEDGDRVRYDFLVNGVPFCDLRVQAHQIKGFDAPVVLGRIPEVDSNAVPSLRDWPSSDQAVRAIKDYMEGIQGPTAIALLSASRCIAIDGSEPLAVWKMIVEIDHLPYSVLAGDSVFRFNPHYFDVTGTARVFDSNPFDGKLVDYTVGRLTGDGTLTSDVFVTDPVGVSRVTSASHRFVYDVKEAGFDEASVFIHATEALEWFYSLGYKYLSQKPFRLRPHAVINGDKNNALYTPETSSAGPTIMVGDGDGVWLQNLPKDADVVSHEFGHHVIFRTLKEVRGESLVLHEGLADFFTFARTGNACLGESICPVNSPIPCEIMAQCLRSGDTKYRFGDSDLPKEAHRRSQFVSGMLWDLRKTGEIPAEMLTRIVFKSLEYLLEDSGYHDLVLSLLMSDKELFNGKYGCTIYNAAQDRGLSQEIADFSCDGNLPALISGSGTKSPSGTAPTVKSTGSSSKSGCAVIGNGHLADPSVFGVYFLLFLLPLVLVAKQIQHREQVIRHESKSSAIRG